MNAERLGVMVNDMASYFEAEPDRALAVEGMVLHMQRFWEPRMRLQVVRYLRGGGTVMVPLACEAVAELGTRLDEIPPPPNPEGGGDAG